MRNDAIAEHIALISIWFFGFPTVLDDFWSHIAHRSTSFIAFAIDSLIKQQTKPKINDMGLESGKIDQNILRFEVSVYNTSVMDILNSFRNLP